MFIKPKRQHVVDSNGNLINRQNSTISDLIKPKRIQQIKKEQLKRSVINLNKKSPYLIDILVEAEGEGCAACFV